METEWDTEHSPNVNNTCTKTNTHFEHIQT